MKNAMEAADRAAMHHILPPDLFSGLLAIAADAVIAVDEEQRIIFFNEGAERIFGWRADEVGGKYLEMLLPERYRPSHQGHVQGFGAAHGRARLMGERQQISGQRKSGEEFPAEAAIQRLEVNGKNFYATVLRDISARQRAEDLLHQAIQARDDMMGIVSHDLRNPANAVKMLARSILESDDQQALSADVIERLAIIRQAAEQIDALIEDLLDISRLEAGRLMVAPRAMEVNELLKSSLESMQPLAESSGLSLDMTLLPSAVFVRADPERVTQLLSNLIGNALKFTPTGGRVSLSIETAEREATFTVKDTGEGIAPDELPHVFERFFQSKHRRASRHGAGLGLPIARGIVEAHGGRIWIDSLPGQGTSVSFTLPVVRDDEEPIAAD